MATEISEGALDHSGNQGDSREACVQNDGAILGGSKGAVVSLIGLNIAGALRGTRGPDQQRIAETAIDWTKTLLAKNSDYGSSVWEVPLLTPNLDPAQAILVRMSDKIKRIQALMRRPAEVANESLDDSIKDLGAYCLLYLARPKAQ